MRTSDEQRREVAQKLRETCDEIERTGNGLTVWELTDILDIRDDDSSAMEGLNIDDARHLADLIDRGECENVYDGSVQDSCDNGFLCSACGCKVEDEEHYRVSGTLNFCLGCGRVVRMADWMRLAPSPSVELLRPDGPVARAAAAIMANLTAGFKEDLAPELRGVARDMRKFCKSLDPVLLRARARALRRSRRNVETLKREGRCR